MKKHILFLVLIPLCAGLKAQQQYVRCLDGGVIKWSSIEYIMDGGYSSTDYIVSVDTTINNIVYKKIYLGGFDDFEETNTNWKNNFSIDPNLEMEYYIRESEDASRLYVLRALTDFKEEKEYLIFDLNLQVGDEFQFTDMWSDNYQTCTVDSVFIEDGLKHVQFDYDIWLPDGDLHKLTFIEGVGPNVWPVPWMDWSSIITCFQNQSLFYKNPQFPFPCGYFSEGGNIPAVFSQANYTIQQTDNSIEIRFLSPINAQLTIYDLRGRLYYLNESVFGESVIIPTASFPKGIYLLKILNKNKMSVSKIIL